MVRGTLQRGVVRLLAIAGCAVLLVARGETASFSAFERLVIVSAGSDTAANGQTLRSALAFAAAATPSATEPWTLRLGPGVYDLGTTGLVMVPFVDIEGSGEGTTRITAQTDGEVERAALCGADNAELRHLTVENTGPGPFSRAIFNFAVAPRITHVTAIASGGTNNNMGITNGGAGFQTVMTAVTTIGTGGEFAEGMVNATSAEPVLIQVTARASGGSVSNWAVINAGAFPTIRESKLEATGLDAAAIINVQSGSADVANSQLIGGVSGPGFTCVGVYDGSFAALGTACT